MNLPQILPSILKTSINRQFLIGLATALMMSGCDLPPPQASSFDSPSQPSSIHYKPTIYTWGTPAAPGNAQPIKGCVTWEKFTSVVESGDVSLNIPIPELPDRFKQGCIFADVDVHTLNIYVLKNGLRKTAPVHADLAQLHPLYKFVPLPQGFDVFKLIDRGQALVVMFDSPDQIDKWFIQKNAWDQAYVDQENHTVMFRYLYMHSKATPLAELARLLEATRSQWDSVPVNVKAKP
ncbi:MAG: hypothetical protein QNJ46_31045 [Leptolyngbyaceae cyanobacterium MO_188.B28]|nr:hypothetical protein [Leptolyngbyaceae cyanobacterium MO_188.B28]